MTTFRVRIHEHRGSGIFQHLRTRLLTGIGESLLGIVDDEFLAKGIDETLGTSCDDELIGIGGGETDGVSNLITP